MRVAFSLCPVLSVSVPGLNLVESPQAQPLTEALRFTVPLKLPTLVTVIVEFSDEPAGMLRAWGLAESVKPCTRTVTVAVLIVVPLCPVTVTIYVPELLGIAVMFRIDPISVQLLQGWTRTVDGFKVAVGAEETMGETVAVRGTGPEKRLNTFTVIVELADLPGSIVTLLGFAFREKL
jgi:hypothetical protein